MRAILQKKIIKRLGTSISATHAMILITVSKPRCCSDWVLGIFAKEGKECCFGVCRVVANPDDFPLVFDAVWTGEHPTGGSTERNH